MVLLMLVMISSLWALSRTYAATPSGHTLTYTEGKLEWDISTTVLPDGSARLELFDNDYLNDAKQSTVKSADGARVVAPRVSEEGEPSPGSFGSDSVILRNTVKRSVKYTAVAYKQENTEDIPIEAAFTGTGEETASYTLPDGLTQAQILGAYTGTAGSGSEVGFSLSWEWKQDGATQDEIDIRDTALGRKENLDTVAIGLMITVEDEGSSYSPGPSTGDNGLVLLYGSLFILSLLTMIILLRRDKDEEKREKGKA